MDDPIITPTIPGAELSWRAAPDVARALGFKGDTATFYNWCKAMDVETITIAARRKLVNVPSLNHALNMWARAQAGEPLSQKDWSRIDAATTGKSPDRLKEGKLDRIVYRMTQMLDDVKAMSNDEELDNVVANDLDE